MKLFGLISWYEESPSWLAATVVSLAQVGCDHIIALDGAYGLYPEGRPRSGPEQAEAIYHTANAAGLGCTIHAPSEVWFGNEVEKRSKLFALAATVSEPLVDWWFVMDADQLITEPWQIKPRLEETDLDVAETMFVERFDPQATQVRAEVTRHRDWGRGTQFVVRNLFRAIPGLRVETNHYTYVTGDGRYLWGNVRTHKLEEALPLHDVRIDHRTWFRDKHRHDAQYTYYGRRDKGRIECEACFFCGAPSDLRGPYNFNWQDQPGGDLIGDEIDVCSECAPKADKRNIARLRYLNYPVDQLGIPKLNARKMILRKDEVPI